LEGEGAAAAGCFGLFALERIRRWDVIGAYSGEVKTADVFDREAEEDDGKETSYTFALPRATPRPPPPPPPPPPPQPSSSSLGDAAGVSSVKWWQRPLDPKRQKVSVFSVAASASTSADISINFGENFGSIAAAAEWQGPALVPFPVHLQHG
jgi:hypothetical protein